MDDTCNTNYVGISCAECHKETEGLDAMVIRPDGVLVCADCGSKIDAPTKTQIPSFWHVPPSEGVRFDDGKPRMDLLPGDALIEIAKVFSWGAKKYSDRNWEKGMDWHKLYAPIQRHLWKWWQGEELDGESGLHHLAHAACDILMLQATVLRNTGTDDRPKGSTAISK